MDAFDPKGGEQPEAKLQAKFKTYLELRGWAVEVTHGSIMQKGLPDLYCTHPKHGPRWIDMKVKGRYKITAAQYVVWPKFCRHGSGVWIIALPKSMLKCRITKVNNELMQAEYNKLWEPFNWHTYIPTSQDPERKALKLEMEKMLNYYHDRKKLYG